MTTKLTVAILPGFAEGKYQSHQFRQALSAAGYAITEDVRAADVIIAHSAGCYMVPAEHQAKAVLNIGYTYWPGRSLLRGLGAKMIDEYRRMSLAAWLKKTVMNGLMVGNVMQTARSVRGWRNRKRHLTSLTSKQVFIRSSFDPYCHAESIIKLAGDKHTYISLAGYHDQLWQEPEPYVNLLKSIV